MSKLSRHEKAPVAATTRALDNVETREGNNVMKKGTTEPAQNHVGAAQIDPGAVIIRMSEVEKITGLKRATIYPRPTEHVEQMLALGFTQVASGPFVRSSYHAREMAEVLPATAPAARPM